MDERIARTEQFLREKFEQSDDFSKHPDRMRYRLMHSYRVANIGRQIAEAEGLAVVPMTVGCLLHDVSYCLPYASEAAMKNHGRVAAKIARPFLLTLDLDAGAVEEICYGIAIHVDDCADFPGVRSPFALSIGDADNIDRFDVYRIYENLAYMDFAHIAFDAQLAHTDAMLAKLDRYRELPFGTPAATALWREKLAFQREFFLRLRSQLRSGESIH